MQAHVSMYALYPPAPHTPRTQINMRVDEMSELTFCFRDYDDTGVHNVLVEDVFTISFYELDRSSSHKEARTSPLEGGGVLMNTLHSPRFTHTYTHPPPIAFSGGADS